MFRAPDNADRIDRRELLMQIANPDLSIVALVAPAGFGKSQLAYALGATADRFVVCDCAGISTARDVAQRIAAGFASDGAAQTAVAHARIASIDVPRDAATWSEFAIQLWGQGNERSVVLLDNAEALTDSEDARALLFRVLSVLVPNRTVVLCSRRPVPVRLTRFAPAHAIVSLHADDLAFTVDDIGKLFAREDLGAGEVERIHRITGGWPIAVLMLRRLVRDRGARGALSDTGALGDGLYDYLVEQVLDGLGAPLLEALLCCAVASAMHVDDGALLIDPDASSVTIAGQLFAVPFVSSRQGTLVIHPLVADTLRRRFAGECRAAARHLAERWLERGDVVRAARFFLDAGEPREAARALDMMHPYVFAEALPDCAEIVASLPPDIICAYPNMWLATIPLRSYGLSLADYEREAEQMHRSSGALSQSESRIAVLMEYSSALYLNGRVDEALALVEAKLSTELPPRQRASLALHLAGRLGLQGRYSEARARCAEASGITPTFGWGRALDYVDAHEAFALGEYERGFASIEQALRFARRSGVALAEALSLGNGAVFAWVVGDDERFARFISELDAALIPGIERGFRFFITSARGDFTQPDDDACMNRVALVYSHLFRAAAFSSAEARAAAARRAAAIADEARDPYTQVVAHLAVAVLVAGARVEAFAAAEAAAARIESQVLHDAVAAARFGRSGHMLDAYLRRFTPGARQDSRATVRVDVLAGTVFQHGQRLALSDRELGLVMALALAGRPVSRERLTDVFWPDFDPSAAANNLKVQVHRVRRRLADAAVIRWTEDGFALSTAVDVDYHAVVSRTRSLLGREIGNDDRHWLEEIAQRLRPGRPQGLLNQDWFVGAEREIVELHRQVCVLLARALIATDHPQGALPYVDELIAVDPYDETARELRIRAHVASGDEPGAMREWRRYRDLLRAELGTEPSASLRALFPSIPTEATR